MADVGSFGINTDTDEIIDEMGGSRLLPEGWIKGVIVGDEVKLTKDGSGRYLNFEIIAPDFGDAKVWVMLNLWNQSDKAAQIARGQLAAVAKACGLKTIADSSQVHNKVLAFKNKHDTYDGKTRNKVVGFKPVADVEIVTDSATDAIPAPVASPAKSTEKPFWE